MAYIPNLQIPKRPAHSTEWPATVDLILSAMESGQHGQRWTERRSATRLPHRVCGSLLLFTDAPDAPLHAIYTRDISTRGLAFITQSRLPLGYGGFIEFVSPIGDTRRVQCTLYRCREAVPEWYEAFACFNREQPDVIEV